MLSTASPIDTANIKSNMTMAAASSAGIPTQKRDFIRVDLHDFDNRQEEIIETLMKAATNEGFFYGMKQYLPSGLVPRRVI